MKTLVWMTICLLVYPFPSYGFGPTGHRTVAEIASHHLNAETARRVSLILDGQLMASAATWPDDMRSASLPSTDFWANAANWHFVNVAQGQVYKKANAPPSCPSSIRELKKFEDQLLQYDANAYQAIECFSSILRNAKAGHDVQQFALKFVIHLAGDLHQPLHLGHGTDAGGNTITLKYFGETTELHALWDSDVIDRQQLSFTELARFQENESTARAEELSDPNPYNWLLESFEPREVDPLVMEGVTLTLREEFYERINAQGQCGRVDVFSGDGDNQADGFIRDCRYEFSFNAVPMINMQLQKGGFRLAALLNQIFDPS